MFQPPLLFPLTPGQMGGLSTAFNSTTENLRDGLLAMRADIAQQNIAAFGAGRFVSSVAEIGSAGAVPVGGARAGSGLAVELPRALWLVDGILVDIAALSGYVEGAEPGEGLVSLDDAPAGGDFWGYLSLLHDEEAGYSLEVEWLAAPDGSRRRGGNACIGQVTTSADSVTAIDFTSADLIWSQAILQSKIAALVAGAGAGAGGGGDGGAGFISTTPTSPDIATDGKTYFEALIATLEAKVNRIEGGAELFPQPFAILADEIALNRAGIAEVNPHAVERGQISVVVKQAGLGQSDTPNYSPSTGDPLELPYDESEGVFGP